MPDPETDAPEPELPDDEALAEDAPADDAPADDAPADDAPGDEAADTDGRVDPVGVVFAPDGERLEIEVQVDNAPSNCSFRLFVYDMDEQWAHELTAGATHLDRPPFPLYRLDAPLEDAEGLIVRCFARLAIDPPAGARIRLVCYQGPYAIGEAASAAVEGAPQSVAVQAAVQFVAGGAPA